MNKDTEFDTDLTVQSFAYVAKQLARSSTALTGSAQYQEILNEAERHRNALRLMQRDAFDLAEQGLRKKTLSKAEYQQARAHAARSIAQAQQAIMHIAAEYAPHKLAA
jgi:hypothetical protein